jgi:hypothetical protein
MASPTNPRIDSVGQGVVRQTIRIWNDGKKVQLWRRVFERRAPGSIEAVEKILDPTPFGQGTWTDNTSDALLEALRHAYEEATGPQGA